MSGQQIESGIVLKFFKWWHPTDAKRKEDDKKGVYYLFAGEPIYYVKDPNKYQLHRDTDEYLEKIDPYAAYREFIELDLDNDPDAVEDFLRKYGPLSEPTTEEKSKSPSRLGFVTTGKLKKAQRILQSEAKLVNPDNAPNLKARLAIEPECVPAELIDYFKLAAYLEKLKPIKEILCEYPGCTRLVGNVIEGRADQVACPDHRTANSKRKAEEEKQLKKQIYKDYLGDEWKKEYEKNPKIAEKAVLEKMLS